MLSLFHANRVCKCSYVTKCHIIDRKFQKTDNLMQGMYIWTKTEKKREKTAYEQTIEQTCT